MTPAERLLAAADLLEKRAEEATDGSWGVYVTEGDTARAIIGGEGRELGIVEDPDMAMNDAHYIATMHPEVGKAVAKMLHEEARRVSLGFGWTQEALALADLLLAGAS